MKVEMDVLGSPSLIVPSGSYGLCGRKATSEEEFRIIELRSCVKVEMDVLGSLSLTVRMVSVDAKQHLNNNNSESQNSGAV